MKILGRVVSRKPIALSRAAKLISRFAAVENGSSPAISLYLQRAADAFNDLVQSRDKRSKSTVHSSQIENEIINDGDIHSAEMKKKVKKGKSGEASFGSENINFRYENNKNVVRESEIEIINDGDIHSAQKKKRKRGDAVSEDVVRETVKEIVNDGDSTEAPAEKTKKKKKKKKKKKTGES